MKFRKFLILAGKKFSAAMQAFISWVLSDGGIVEAQRYVYSIFKTATNASILQIPSAYKAEVLYNQIPITPDNDDFTVARASDVWRTNEQGVLEVANTGYGPDVVVNGGFDTDTVWLKNIAWTISGGTANNDGSNPAAVEIRQLGILTIGKKYTVTFTVLNRIIGRVQVRLGFGVITATVNANGTYTFTGEAAGDDLFFYGIDSFEGSIDNVSVQELITNDVPCIDYSDGFPVLLTQPQSTNLYLNNETLSTQNVTTSAIPYTVSFYGTGTITFTGTHTGSLVGTGVSDRVQVTFTPTAGTLTSTVSGTVTKGQIEALSYATTIIPTTGATATRLADVITGAGSTSSINSEEGVLVLDSASLASDGTDRYLTISDGTTSSWVGLRYTSIANLIHGIYNVAGVEQGKVTYNLTDEKLFNLVVFKWKVNDFELYVNGVSVGTDINGNVNPINTLNKINFGSGIASTPFYGKTKQLRVYPSIAAAQIDLPYIT